MPKKTKKKAKRKLEEDEEDALIISTSNSKPVEIEDEDDSPFVSQSKGKKKKKKYKTNPIEDSTKEKTEENESCYLPGQKHDRPNERDPLRIFFETLYQQLPDCELAATWMMEWGLLPPDEATKLYELQLEKNQQGEQSSPAEAVSLKKTSEVSSRKEDKKRKIIENSSSDDFILSNKKKKKKKQKVSSS